MRITLEDYDKLAKLLDEKLDEKAMKRFKEYKQDLPFRHPPPNNKDTALRWALLRVSGIRIGDGIGVDGDINLYHYLNDIHIDTALGLYMRERGL